MKSPKIYLRDSGLLHALLGIETDEDLLLNSRMVQGIFDDLNPETVTRWAYPDTGVWVPDRNTNEFIAAMPSWKAHGLMAFTLNLQGGSPEGYSKTQLWINSAFNSDGSLRPDYSARAARIINKADELGMVAILGYLYFGQDERLADEPAVIRAVRETTEWIFANGWQNVLVEINNECDIKYEHAVLQPPRVVELIRQVKSMTHEGRRLLVFTSFSGGKIPPRAIVDASDFILLHGNGVNTPGRIRDMVRETRVLTGADPKPIVFNEDDHFDFDKPENNFVAALEEGASWDFFAYRKNKEDFTEGYQSVPVDWTISHRHKRGFFNLLAEVIGSKTAE